MSDLSNDEFMSLVEAAVLAPSADNRHLFRLERFGSGIRLWAEPEFLDLPHHHRILCLISFGAAAENIKLRSLRWGRVAHVKWFPDDAKPRLVAEIDLARISQPGPVPLEVAIAQRHTNRRVWFRGPALSPAELDDMSGEVRTVAGVQLAWFDVPDARQQIVRLIRLAETERFRSRLLHAELFSAVRFDVGWKSSASEGLPPGSLEVEPPMRPIFGALRHWELQRLLNAVGLHHAFGLRAAYLPCHLAPHVGALTTSLDVAAGALATGAALERVWLRATLLGMSLQPFAGAAVLGLADYPGVSLGLREALAQGWKRLAPGRLPMMVFRIGHAPPPSVRTARRPLDDYVMAPSPPL